MSKKMYQRGEKINCVSELLDHDFFIMSTPTIDKTLHAGFIRSWQLQTCNKLVQAGMLYISEKLDVK